MEAIHLVSPIGSVLEIGCTTGFRLDKAQRAFGAQCAGLEASDSAVTEGAEKYPKIDIRQGVAPQDLNQWSGSKFDVVVVGHLMYLLPRSVLFEFAAQVDSLLADNGHLIVVDFHFITKNTVASYAHQDSLLLYKGDPSGPWSWNPQYFLIYRDVYPLSGEATSQREPNQWQSIDVLRKLSESQAYENVNSPKSVHTLEGS